MPTCARPCRAWREPKGTGLPAVTRSFSSARLGDRMQPQIVTLDYGRHNANLDVSTSRILHGASWKKQRIIVLIPSAAMIPAKVALSHWGLIFPPNNGVYRMLCLGMEVGDAYSQAIEQVLAHPELNQWEYILTLEHDNIVPPDGVLKLLETMEARPELACVGGLYWTKGEAGVPQIWGDVTDPVLNFRPQVPRAGEVQECCGTGMGFNLWRLSMFKDERLPRPLFKTKAGADGVGTQDLSFWGEARKWGYRCAIDNRVLVGHFDHQGDLTW
mgnify:CR=1 FL=1